MKSASSGSNAPSIPPGITREDVEKAIREFEAGVEHGFGPSTFYDLAIKPTGKIGLDQPMGMP